MENEEEKAGNEWKGRSNIEMKEMGMKYVEVEEGKGEEQGRRR